MPVAVERCAIGGRIAEAEREAEAVFARRAPSGNRCLRLGPRNSMPGAAHIGAVIARHRVLSISVRVRVHNGTAGAVLKRDVGVGVLPNVPGASRTR